MKITGPANVFSHWASLREVQMWSDQRSAVNQSRCERGERWGNIERQAFRAANADVEAWLKVMMAPGPALWAKA